MPDQNITIRAPTALVAAFRAHAWSQGHQKPSAALRAFMEGAVKAPGPVPSPAVIPAPTPSVPARKGRRPALVGTYVTTAERDEIAAAAVAYGGIAAWLRGAIDARMGKAAELPALAEIQALYAATTELWRVGRNLNQIARHMNEAKRAGMPVPTDALKPQLLAQVVRSVDKLAERTDAVIAAAKRRGFGRE